jgi:hypothetical protein
LSYGKSRWVTPFYKYEDLDILFDKVFDSIFVMPDVKLYQIYIFIQTMLIANGYVGLKEQMRINDEHIIIEII